LVRNYHKNSIKNINIYYLRCDPLHSGEDSGILGETMPEGQAGDCESLWKKMIGKPYSGKLNIRFDEWGWK